MMSWKLLLYEGQFAPDLDGPCLASIEGEDLVTETACDGDRYTRVPLDRVKALIEAHERWQAAKSEREGDNVPEVLRAAKAGELMDDVKPNPFNAWWWSEERTVACAKQHAWEVWQAALKAETADLRAENVGLRAQLTKKRYESARLLAAYRGMRDFIAAEDGEV